MTVRCIIVEDEPLARVRLTDYIGRLLHLGLAGVFDNAAAALSFVLANPVDLMFLDISLGGMSGIELLEASSAGCEVILTTAHPEHALRAYELKVADYLLKPYSFARFVQAVEQAQLRLAAKRAAPDRDYLFIKTELRLERVRFTDIVYIEGDSDYRCIHTTQKDIMTLATFGELEQRIPAALVCRVHKSYMVAVDKIDAIECDRITIGKATIPIAASRRDRFYALIGHRPK